MAEQAPDDAALALHRVQVAVPVAAADREAGNEVVEDEVVQDDDAGPLPQRLDDPAVRVRVVADVVEVDVDVTQTQQAAPADRDDLDAPFERRQEEGAVVSDPRAVGRERRVVGDLHDSSLSTT